MCSCRTQLGVMCMARGFLNVILAACLLNGCGGGGGDSPAVSSPAPAPPPTSSGSSYFYFSSGHDALSVLDTPQSKSLIGKYSNVVAGIDAGGDTGSSALSDRMQKMRSYGWRLHVYLEGPGGPTGRSWSPDECIRVHSAAQLYVSVPVPPGDQCRDDSAAWMKEWNDTGFFRQLQSQLRDLQALGVESVEVDNLYRAGYGDGGKPLSEFVTRFMNGKTTDNSIRLLLKNVSSPAELDAVLAASPRSAIADFMILEEDLKGQWCAIRAAGNKYGIVTAFSWDTADYHAEVDSFGKDLVLSGPQPSERQAFSCP